MSTATAEATSLDAAAQRDPSAIPDPHEADPPPSEPARVELSPSRRFVVTVALMCGTFLGSLDVTVVGTAMPSIAAELGGLALYGWVFSAYLLTATVTVPLYGRLADLWGRRPTYLLGAGVFLLGSVACGLAPTMPLLVAARAVQGLGAGALVPITLVVIGDLYPLAQRVRVMSVFSLVWGVSSVIGPTAGGLLVKLGWPWVFWINLPIGGVACLVLAVSLRDPPLTKRPRIDWQGALTITGASLAVLGGMTAIEAGHGALGTLSIALGVALGFVFVRIERRATDPVVPPSLMRDRAIAVGTVLGVLLGGALFTNIAFVPLYMRAVGGYGTVAAGAALIPMSLAWTTGAFVSGRLIMRFGYRMPVRLGSALVGIASALSVVASILRTPELVIGASGVLGAGLGLGVTAVNVVAQDRVGFRLRGAATALLQFARTMGGMLLVSLLGLVLANHLARRLAEIDGAPDPSALVDPDLAATLPAEMLARSRDAIEGALFYVFLGAGIAGALGFAVALWFPKVSAEPAPARG